MNIQVDPAIDYKKEDVNRKRPVIRQGSNVKSELDKIVAVGRPWWSEAPEVVHKCLTLIFAPIRLLAMLLDIVVSMTFISVFGTVALWWFGYISDEFVAKFISSIGDRVLSIIQSSGVL